MVVVKEEVRPEKGGEYEQITNPFSRFNMKRKHFHV